MKMSKINTMENWLAQRNINDCNDDDDGSGGDDDDDGSGVWC